jgi:hypothetical protein
LMGEKSVEGSPDRNGHDEEELQLLRSVSGPSERAPSR